MDHALVLSRHELSDPEREVVRPLLPVRSRDRMRWDDRTVLDGLVWTFRTGVARREVPERYGPGARLHTGFRRWADEGPPSGCRGQREPGRTRVITHAARNDRFIST
ncbi:transposase [Streptomyces achromogenes]|uniref:transposase n=1 Tax=Streptomyces achromogenes TaxID=67255 RepID=UPI0033EBAD83